jgi:hypothetical protein
MWVQCVQLEQQNALILNTIIKNREDCKHDKEFAKIVEKMQKGKNLKKKEFTKIHWVLWEKGR